jgi:hypothetical protein
MDFWIYNKHDPFSDMMNASWHWTLFSLMFLVSQLANSLPLCPHPASLFRLPRHCCIDRNQNSSSLGSVPLLQSFWECASSLFPYEPSRRKRHSLKLNRSMRLFSRYHGSFKSYAVQLTYNVSCMHNLKFSSSHIIKVKVNR